ncbi:MAG: hypothetical protein JXA72_03970 [Bacteroidales bacterium]|nr:hypothetical protein [Bacteroidales bacterium]
MAILIIRFRLFVPKICLDQLWNPLRSNSAIKFDVNPLVKNVSLSAIELPIIKLSLKAPQRINFSLKYFISKVVSNLDDEPIFFAHCKVPFKSYLARKISPVVPDEINESFAENLQLL